MSPAPGQRPGTQALLARARTVSGAADRAALSLDIQLALGHALGPVERAALLMCRAQAGSNQLDGGRSLADALAAMELFERSGQVSAALEAASLAAALASRQGDLSLAAELATKSIAGVCALADPHLEAEVGNRLAVFCNAFLDYDRAVEQLRLALVAAERTGDEWQVMRELHNLADALLLAVRQERAAGWGDGRRSASGRDRVRDAAAVVERMLAEGSVETLRRLGVQRLQAELLIEDGRPAEALELLRATSGHAGETVWAMSGSALALSEARALRALGCSDDAVAAARRALDLAAPGDDPHHAMHVLDELVGALHDSGAMAQALAGALELKRRMWAVYRDRTAQLVEQVWARAALEYGRKALEAQTAAAIRSAEEDALTRTGNRRLLERCLSELAAIKADVSLLMADIDHFKDINDTFGHEVGDHVLRAVGHMLATDARTGQFVVRYGGEEFVFALPEVDLPAARDFAERIRTRVRAYPWEELDARLGVTISIGVAQGGASNWRSVLASADRALYLAKQKGRNRVEVATRSARRTA